MSRLFAWRQWLYWGLGLLIVANVVVYFSWLRGLAQRIVVDPARIQQLEREVAERTGEVERLKRVQEAAPTAAPRLDAFAKDRFWAESVGYSRTLAELTETASKAGVRFARRDNKAVNLKERPELVQVDMRTTVGGTYPNLVRFLQGLESSPRFYLIRELTVGENTGGQVQLDMTVVTYFRRGAA